MFLIGKKKAQPKRPEAPLSTPGNPNPPAHSQYLGATRGKPPGTINLGKEPRKEATLKDSLDRILSETGPRGPMFFEPARMWRVRDLFLPTIPSHPPARCTYEFLPKETRWARVRKRLVAGLRRFPEHPVRLAFAACVGATLATPDPGTGEAVVAGLLFALGYVPGAVRHAPEDPFIRSTLSVHGEKTKDMEEIPMQAFITWTREDG